MAARVPPGDGLCDWVDGGRCHHLGVRSLLGLWLCWEHLRMTLAIRDTVLAEREGRGKGVHHG